MQVLFLAQQLFTSSIPRGNSGRKRDAEEFLTKYRKRDAPHIAPAPARTQPGWDPLPQQRLHAWGWVLSSLHFNLPALGVWKKLLKSGS